MTLQNCFNNFSEETREFTWNFWSYFIWKVRRKKTEWCLLQFLLGTLRVNMSYLQLMTLCLLGFINSWTLLKCIKQESFNIFQDHFYSKLQRSKMLLKYSDHIWNKGILHRYWYMNLPRLIKLSSCDLCTKIVSWYILYHEEVSWYISHNERWLFHYSPKHILEVKDMDPVLDL